TTSAPRFGMSSTRPLEDNRRRASRTGVRLTPYVSATSSSRTREPAMRLPLRISRCRSEYTRSAVCDIGAPPRSCVQTKDVMVLTQPLTAGNRSLHDDDREYCVQEVGMDMPPAVEVVEVGPRDGLQNE